MPLPRYGAAPVHSGPATLPGQRPALPAIVRHAGAIWTGTVLPSAVFPPASVIRLHGRGSRCCAPIPVCDHASPDPTSLPTRPGGLQTVTAAGVRVDGI